ncbi:MAG: hypothetical protein ACK4M0_14775 [Phreatobacter sp.]|jgi:hypothetical protein
MEMTPPRIIAFFTVLCTLINPPVVLGLFGPEGRRVGHVIEEGLGTEAVRIALFGRR